jgi:hypothetical protein
VRLLSLLQILPALAIFCPLLIAVHMGRGDISVVLTDISLMVGDVEHFFCEPVGYLSVCFLLRNVHLGNFGAPYVD